MSKVKFLEATRKHRHEIKSVNETTLPENYPDSFWESILANHKTRVVTVGGLVVGYCACETSGMIVSLAVLPEHRRKGYARKLLSQVCTPGMDYSLQVRVDNSSALGLYKSMGFKVQTTHKGYYADGTDAYVMSTSTQSEEGAALSANTLIPERGRPLHSATISDMT